MTDPFAIFVPIETERLSASDLAPEGEGRCGRWRETEVPLGERAVGRDGPEDGRRVRGEEGLIDAG